MWDTGPLEPSLDVLEAVDEAADGGAQRLLQGVAQFPGDVDEREQRVPELVFDLGAVSALDRGVELRELLAVLPGIARVDRLEHLVGLLEDVRAQRGERLLPIPRAAVRAAQAAHDGDESFDRFCWCGHGLQVVPREARASIGRSWSISR